MRDTGNRECSIIFNPRGCRINMSPLCLTASFPAKYFYNISILIWRKPRKYFDKKFQFPNYDPGCFRSYFPLYLTIFQSGFCPQVLCASQRGGGGGGGGWGGRQRRRRRRRKRWRRRGRTLTQNTTLPHNSHTQLRPLAHKMCNFQFTQAYIKKIQNFLNFLLHGKSIEREDLSRLCIESVSGVTQTVKYHPNSQIQTHSLM